MVLTVTKEDILQNTVLSSIPGKIGMLSRKKDDFASLQSFRDYSKSFGKEIVHQTFQDVGNNMRGIVVTRLISVFLPCDELGS